MAESGKIGRGCFGMVVLGFLGFTAMTWLGPDGQEPVRRSNVPVPTAAVTTTFSGDTKSIQTDAGSSEADIAHFAECDSVAAQIAEKLHLELDRISPLEHNIFFRRMDLTDTTLMCGTAGAKPSLSISIDNHPFPPESFFKSAALGGALLTGAPVPKLLAVLHRCHGLALKSIDEMQEDLHAGKAIVSCQAFTRDGGAVSLNVSRGD